MRRPRWSGCSVGPEAGREFPLDSGRQSRRPRCRRRTSSCRRPRGVPAPRDDHRRRRHVTVTDLNSANGVLVDGALVQRAIVTPSTRLQIGAGVLRSLPLTAPRAGRPRRARPFSRSPRVEPAYRGASFTLPEIPVPPDPPRLPLLVLLSPLLLGAVLFALTQQVTTLALRRTLAADHARHLARQPAPGRDADDGRARSAFEAGMADARARLGGRARGGGRVHGAPSRRARREVAAAIGRARPAALDAQARAHDLPRGAVRAGAQASRSSIRMPSKNAGDAADWTAALATWSRSSPRSVRCPSSRPSSEPARSVSRASARSADEAARALVVQLAGLHSPADLGDRGVRRRGCRDAWSWLKWLPHVDSPYSPLRSNGLVSDYAAGAPLLSELEGLVAARRAAGAGRAAGVRSRLDESASARRRPRHRRRPAARRRRRCSWS